MWLGIRRKKIIKNNKVKEEFDRGAEEQYINKN